MIGRIVNGLAAAAGAALFAQFPAFYQQYLQRLGGRLDQARLDVDQIIADAATLGRTLEAYIQELLASGTDAARLAAKRELARVDNADRLSQAYEAMSEAGLLQRPFVFVEHMDAGLAQETVRIFEPAVPVTLEGLIYAAFGLVTGLGLLMGCTRAGRPVAGWIDRRAGLRQSDRTEA